MLSDFEILKLITSPNPGLKLPQKLWLIALHQTVEWSLLGKSYLVRRIKKLSREEASYLLNSVNHWRKISKLKPLKTTANASFPVEIAHLAKLKAFQLSRMMAKKGSAQEKRNWVLKSLKSDFYLNLSKKTFLGDECLDRILGLNERKVKTELFGRNIKNLYRNEDVYLDLDPEDLFTPYRVLADISDKLKLNRDVVVDLGSGLGRVGIVMGLLNPKIKFIGLELMKERHAQAEKASKHLKLSNRIKFECCDLAKNPIPEANYYYLFNPFSYLTLRRVFLNLQKNSRVQPLKLVMAQVGRPPRMVKRHPWLRQVYLSPLDRNWRAHGFSVYQSR